MSWHLAIPTSRGTSHPVVSAAGNSPKIHQQLPDPHENLGLGALFNTMTYHGPLRNSQAQSKISSDYSSEMRPLQIILYTTLSGAEQGYRQTLTRQDKSKARQWD
jgi:hypothetical protein